MVPLYPDLRWALALAIPLVILGTGAPVAAQQEASHRVDADRVVSAGRLIASGKARNGTPRYGLLENGRLTAYVVPASGVDLAKYVDRSVVITARLASTGQDGLPYLLAQSVRAQGRAAASSASPGAAADSSEPMSASSELEDADEPRLIADWRMESDSGSSMLGGAEWEEPPPPPVPVDASRRVHRDAAVRPAVGQFAEETIPGPIEPMPMIDDAPLMEDTIVEGDELLEPLPSTSPSIVPSAGCGVSCGNCTSSCCPCGPAGRFWFRTEYLAWWTDSLHTPPLVTTAPITTPAQDAGVLGVGGTQVIAGGGESDDTSRNGMRFLLGGWTDPCQHRGWEVDFFYLADENDTLSFGSIGDPILARPFFNTQLNLQDAELVAFPGIVTGTVTVDHQSEFQSFAPRIRRNLRCENVGAMLCGGCGQCGSCSPSVGMPIGGNRVDVTFGYRYMRLKEGLRISEDLISDAETSFATFNIYDAFDTANEFHGFELGLLWDRYRGRWSMEVASRFAMGNNTRRVAINGGTRSVVQGAAFDDVGGLLALPSNIGQYEDDEFVVIPELSLTLGYQLAPQVRFLVGYTVIYWNNVVRPGEQIDLNVNPDLMPPAVATTGLLAPAFAMNDTSFWAQGINLGLDWRW